MRAFVLRLGLLALVLVPVVAHSGFIRVDQTGGGDATTVLDGMMLASAGDTVAVRHGLHSVTDVEVVDGVQLLGGWNNIFTARTPGTSHLDSNGNQVLRCTSIQDLDTLIDGFEITGASRSAILCTSSSPTITNNEFHTNSGQDGAAIHCEYGASPLIEENHIHHNSANYGAGIRGHWGVDTSPTIRNNLIEYNSAWLTGGGISVNNGSPLIEDNIIRFNTSGNTGGGIHVWHGEGGIVTVRENLIIFNTTGDDGGGIGITGGHPVIESNTFWGNHASRGGCISQATSLLPDPGTSMISNNILGGSTNGAAIECIDDFNLQLDCNCLFDNAGGTYVGCDPGPTDIFEDPQFCDETDGNFTLHAGSPCAPPGPTGCGLIGARNVGCGAVSIEQTTWAQIKAQYRQ